MTIPTPYETTGQFPTVPAVESFALTLLQEYPERVTMQQWGQPSGPATTLGMFTITVGSGPVGVAVLASIHGMTEPAPTSAACAYARDLAETTDPALSSYLDSHSWTFMLLGNPYGTNATRRNNANDEDINRDFDTLQEPENVAIDAWLQWAGATLALDLHETGLATAQFFTSPPIAAPYLVLSTSLDGAIRADLSEFTWAEYPSSSSGTFRSQAVSRWQLLGVLAETSIGGTRSNRVHIHHRILQAARSHHEGNAAEYMTAHIAAGGDGTPAFPDTSPTIDRRRGAIAAL